MNKLKADATGIAMNRRTASALCLAAFLPAAYAAPAKDRAPAPAPVTNWRIVINEAVSGDNNIFLLGSRYRPLAEYLETRMKIKTINVDPVVNIQRFLEIAEGQTKPELVFGKSVNQLAKLVRDHGYQPLVRRAEPYKAAFIVGKDSPIKTLAQASNNRIIMPDEFSATTAVALAELRRQNVGNVEVRHVRYQESVAQQVQAGAAQVGVVNPTTAKKWVEGGGRMLSETQPVVNWSVLGSPALPAATIAQLREALLAMNTQATAVIAGIGVKAWAPAERKDYMDLLAYTKE